MKSSICRILHIITKPNPMNTGRCVSLSLSPCSGEIESFLFSSCSWIDFPLFHDFLTLYLQVSHTARLIYHLHNFQADTFSNTFRQFTNYILFSSLIGKSKSSQSAAIDITQHARIDHKRQQREKYQQL